MPRKTNTDPKCAECGRHKSETASKTLVRGHCRPCYRKLSRNGTIKVAAGRSVPLDKRFWAKVDKRKEDECWEWQGRRLNHEDAPDYDYGVIYEGGIDGGRAILTHRVSWQLHNGPIPKGLYVCHSCDNPSCVNPAHLFLGTQFDNMRDMSKKERGWHRKLTGEQVKEIHQRWRSEKISKSQLACEYGITNSTLLSLLSGQSWHHLFPGDYERTLSPRERRLPDETVREIRRRYDAGEGVKQLMESMGMAKHNYVSIWRIAKRQRYKGVK